ncbi:uncharacterized protein PV09_01115 [Verruconis gallopava]|uniref:Inositol-1-monophosphatase n=1 Tax=Verruconis gallopava TaxID=253628 RepID=A0A0D2BA61_9PEZI|nr:uncharacterized protein PV09_01115 [Verruconis gallopava]KIW08184.1 hypothetical protein PV09_01115 [Verruconis gallopava]
MVSVTDEELKSIYAFAVQLGKDAGTLLQTAAQARMAGKTRSKSVEKANAVDIVTETDEDVEAFVKRRINETYPSHEFVGEESYSKGESKRYLITDKPTWCVDPLDGTVNYVHLFPMYCVSIAFLVNGKPVVGVINAPFLNMLFSARTGGGAWLNETQQLPLVRSPIPPLPQDAPKGCILSCEWGKDRRDVPDGNMYRKNESFMNMAAELGGRGGKGGMVHGVRMLGSATMDLAFTAMGSFDIWWEGGCWEWDVAAGICILEEAGGLVTRGDPPEDAETAAIENVNLGGRLYLGIRPAGQSDSGETARESQERVVREVWKRVRRLDYSRPGV